MSNKTPPSAELLTRLVKLCGMLGSDHDGERASAGLKASKLLMENHLTLAKEVAFNAR